MGLRLVEGAASTPPRRRARWIVLAVLLVTLVAWHALWPFLLVFGAVVGVLAIVITRAVVHKLTRPLGQLSVLDVVLGAIALRWWERRRDRGAVGPSRSSKVW